MEIDGKNPRKLVFEISNLRENLRGSQFVYNGVFHVKLNLLNRNSIFMNTSTSLLTFHGNVPVILDEPEKSYNGDQFGSTD